jgi:DNA polymerase bacteriophage-type
MVKKPWGDITPSVTFWTVDGITKQWVRKAGYGGLWCENAVQACARDILAEAMPKLEAAGYPIVMTSHDEPVCEVPKGFGSVDEICEILCQAVPWAPGLPLAAKGWRGKRYKKG